MRDQPALCIHDVGVAFLADPDLGDDVADEFQIDLGDGHVALLAAAARGERHVGLALLAEVDRAEIRACVARAADGRLVREIRLAAGHVHGETRDAQLFLAAAVDERDLGDGGRLAQQAIVIDPPLLEPRGVRQQRQLRGPADLGLDLLDELADHRGRRDGLLLLDLGECLFLALVGEVAC